MDARKSHPPLIIGLWNSVTWTEVGALNLMSLPLNLINSEC